MSIRSMRRFSVLLPMILVVLAACGSPAATTTGSTAAPAAPTTAPVATEAPAPAATEAPATEATTAAPEAATSTETEVTATAATENTSEAATAAATEAVATAAAGEAIGEPLTFGMVLVGAINDHGYNQAHYEGAKRAESAIPGSKFIYVDKVNPADRPNVKVEQVVDDLISQGAKLVITNSDDFKDGTRESAEAHPDVTFVHMSGDDVLAGKAPANLGNIWGKMEYGKMMAGCTAALSTKTGKISYLGPLINDETRRLVDSAYLGAKYCWTKVLNKPAADLQFKVTWIGFWFNIPGVTLDPTKVADDFISAGYDVNISGIDTTEGLVEANKAAQSGKQVYALAYDYHDACNEAPTICLGVPYFNWAPTYINLLKAVQGGTWKQDWTWLSPDWKDINNPETSTVGFVTGTALPTEAKKQVDEFIAGLADGSINLWQGPIKFQDGTDFVKEGETASDKQIWYMPQLFEGIEGQSSAPQ